VFAYRIYGTKNEGARPVGKSVKWLEYRLKAHPAFREVMDS